MPKFKLSCRTRSSLTLTALVVALLSCTAKERDLSELATAENGGASGGEGTAQGGTTKGGGGGSTSMGGTTTRGGSSNRGGSQNGGTTSEGGTTNTGGSTSTGGTTNTGGSTSTGGTTNTGGSTSTGGTTNTGGSTSTGGTTAVVGPSVVITAGPPEGSTSNLTKATFTFGSSPSGATKYECGVNGESYADCTSSISISNLAAGSQKLLVRAYNAANVVGPVLTRTWNIVALSTTIKTLRGGSIPENTLAILSTGVRLSGMYNATKDQLVFVQEAEMKYPYSVDDAKALDGDPILNSGILTRPLVPMTLMKNPGFAVTVTGVFTNNQNNAELIRATYVWGTLGTPYTVPTIRTADVLGESLEGIRINIAGGQPLKNCISATNLCQNDTIGNAQRCIEACSSTNCAPISWIPLGATAGPYTAGNWVGHLIQTGDYHVFGVVDSSDQNDACL